MSRRPGTDVFDELPGAPMLTVPPRRADTWQEPGRIRRLGIAGLRW
jgi:hypothetical protein